MKNVNTGMYSFLIRNHPRLLVCTITVQDGPYHYEHRVLGAKRTATLANLTLDTTYVIRVAAYSGEGQGLNFS